MSTCDTMAAALNGQRPGPEHHLWLGDGMGRSICKKCGKVDGSMPPPLFERCPEGTTSTAGDAP